MSETDGTPSLAGFDQYLASMMTSGGTGQASEPTVLRRTTRVPTRVDLYGGRTAPEPGMPSQRSVDTVRSRQQRAGLDAYNGEFWDRWEDTNFQAWLTSRLVATGRAKAGAVGPQEAYAGWVEIGEEAARAVGWRGTPEQLLEFYASGRMVDQDEVDAAMRAGALATLPDGSVGTPEQNPITTHTSTSYASINPLAANAAIDQLAQSLLGRMASGKELARYRKTMNSILKSNPTVTTTVSDATDPDNVQTTSRTKDGATAADAQNALQFKLQRSSEGMAFNVGKNFEQALRMMGS